MARTRGKKLRNRQQQQREQAARRDSVLSFETHHNNYWQGLMAAERLK